MWICYQGMAASTSGWMIHKQRRQFLHFTDSVAAFQDKEPTIRLITKDTRVNVAQRTLISAASCTKCRPQPRPNRKTEILLCVRVPAFKKYWQQIRQVYKKKKVQLKNVNKRNNLCFPESRQLKKSPRITHTADLTEAWSILAGEPQGWHIHTLHKAQAASTTAEHLISLTQPHCCWARVGRQKIKQTQ